MWHQKTLNSTVSFGQVYGIYCCHLANKLYHTVLCNSERRAQ